MDRGKILANVLEERLGLICVRVRDEVNERVDECRPQKLREFELRPSVCVTEVRRLDILCRDRGCSQSNLSEGEMLSGTFWGRDWRAGGPVFRPRPSALTPDERPPQCG